MLMYEKIVEDRKVLVHRLSELTGIQSVYTFTPRCAYEIGPYTVDRQGNLLVPDELADEEIILTLLIEELIKEPPMQVTEIEQDETSEEDADNAIPEPVNAEEETAADTEEVEAVSYDFPMHQHKGVSLRNLLNLIYSRGSLINKATGAHFKVSDELVEAMKDDSIILNNEVFLNFLEAFEAEHPDCLEGIELNAEKVCFTGFPSADADSNQAHLQLATLMNRQAISQKRIQAKAVNETNEKYAMRIWLLRIGMNGDEYKATRKILMANLGGHTAFRTQEEAEKAKAKALRKREEQKAARVAAQEASETAGENAPTEPESPTQGEPVGNSEGVSEDEAIPMF